MTNQEKRQWWLVSDQFRKTKERKYTPIFRKVLEAQKAEFIEYYKRTRQAKNKIDSAEMYKAIQSLYIDGVTNYAWKVRAAIKQIKSGRMGFNERMIALVNSYYGLEFLNLSSGITDTTRDILMTVIMESNALGLGFDAIIQKLEQTDISRVRAALIARTETVAAANYGAMLGAKESGVMLQKIWIAAQDDRTRRDHRNVSPDPININDYFDVGGYEMLQPGDKGGKNGKLAVPAKEVCNCRCTIGFIPVKDKAGRIMNA